MRATCWIGITVARRHTFSGLLFTLFMLSSKTCFLSCYLYGELIVSGPKKLQAANTEEDEKAGGRRSIQGNLPYTTSIGVLKRVLERIPESEKPGTFNYDFMSTVLGASGGASRPIIPILKKSW